MRLQHKLAVLTGVLSVALGSQAWAELATVTATLQNLSEQRGFDGRIEAVRQATVSAETRGRIEEIRADIGDRITSGTVILTMTNTEQRAGLNQAEAALAEARAGLVADEAEYQRTRDLFAKDFISKAELDRANARLSTAKARVASAEAALRTAREHLSYTEVKAPYGGIVSARFVEPGEAVQPGTLLMSGYDPSQLRVEVDLPQTVADKVRELRESRVVPVDAADAAGIVPAKLILYPTADKVTSTVRARLELPQPTGNLRPGQFVKVWFTLGSRQRLLIPTASIVHRSEVTAVYVVKDGVPSFRQIRAGAINGDQVEVLAGLTAGETIATDPVAAAIAITGGR